MNFRPEDLQDLAWAVDLLENPSFAARITHAIGTPIEKALVLLPGKWSDSVHEAAKFAIDRALDFSLRTLRRDLRSRSSDTLHKVLSGASGAAGGFFGLPALVVELPLSTTIMLRSIADIARSEGEDIGALSTRLACLEVFALGGRNRADDKAETGYYAVRMALANTVSDAARYIAERGMTYRAINKSAPTLVRLVDRIAARFGVAVSQKFLVQAIPAVGAVGGSTINLLFMDHFQDMARGHFIVRRLERRYGEETVRAEYLRLSRKYPFGA